MENNSIDELKKMLGLGSVLRREIIHPKKDGSKLYFVMGYTLPLRWETIESKGISHDRIIDEADRAEWQAEWREERRKEEEQRQKITENNNDRPF